ncbi:hypothetical protein BEWA_045480 [Theileria equi strain WA]|uniref:Uncharacterized protein n=1 Tax=Theileria equi strain WA TaxID=1537102 RepID=L1LA10_THEEQ|nr:hypothetical protein BEWA_045480 [Theileria equi strain WA]EKX72084.1 hypothetical protein BEWA_045480 [Theileria equi strain WA]|eukprot:XP_004831536.1 hypothetical protein BEWA_045480 [Theileria equi strain WA]
MYYKLICECAECNSVLLQIGAVNVLVNVPLKILRKCAKARNLQAASHSPDGCADEGANSGAVNAKSAPEAKIKAKTGLKTEHQNWHSDVYSAFGCFEIHVIVANTARGLEGLDLLGEFYSLRDTHVVCTRPAYTLANLAEELNEGSSDSTGHSISENQALLDRFRKGISFKGSPAANGQEALRPRKPLITDRDLIESGNVHAVSYNEDVELDIATDLVSSVVSVATRAQDLHEAYNRKHLEHKSRIGKLDPNNARKFITRLVIRGFASGFSLGSANWVITHSDSQVSVAIIGPSTISFNAEHCKGLDYDILKAADYFVVLDSACSFVPVGAVDIWNEQKPHPLQETLEKVCTEAMSSELPVLLPVDIYSEHIFHILNALCDGLQKTTSFIYCVGESMVHLFEFVEKCTEWSNMQDFIRSFQTEDTEDLEILHPLHRIEDIRERGLLYVGNTLDGVKSDFKTPFILVLSVHRGSPMLDYIRTCMERGGYKLIIVDEGMAALLNEDLQDEGASHDWEFTSTFRLDYRADAMEVLPMIPESRTVITSNRLHTFHPNAKFAPTYFVPAEAKFTGFLKGKIKTEDVKRLLLPKLRKVKGIDAQIALVQADVSKSIITLQDTEDIMMIDSCTDTSEEGMESARMDAPAQDSPGNKRPIFFGTFSVYELAKFLESRGYSDLQVSDSEYPKKIWNDDFVITLEGPQKTSIETTDETHRKNIMQGLQQVLSAV